MKTIGTVGAIWIIGTYVIASAAQALGNLIVLLS